MNGRDELDLVKLEIWVPGDFRPNIDFLRIAVVGPVKFWSNSNKSLVAQSLESAGSNEGITYFRIAPSAAVAGAQLIYWVEVLNSTKMNGIELAVLRDTIPFPFINQIKQYDRCTITGIWATGISRTTQDRASVINILGMPNTMSSTLKIDGPLQELPDGSTGGTVLIYDKDRPYNQPKLVKVASTHRDTVDPSIWFLELETPLPVMAVNWEVRVGPNRFAESAQYHAAWTQPEFKGRLGTDDLQQTHKNGIELQFHISPVEATDIRISAAHPKLLRFDVTRQASSVLWRNGEVIGGPDLFPDGDELPNDDGGPSDEDNSPNNGWIFSFDAPGISFGQYQPAHPPFGTVGNPIGWTIRPVGTLYEMEFEAREFARVIIGADSQNGALIEGSRCSNKLDWRLDYAATLEQISNASGDFIWAKRIEGLNYVGE